MTTHTEEHRAMATTDRDDGIAAQLEELVDLAAYLAAHVHTVPTERRLQAIRHLERCEALVPLPALPEELTE